MGGPRDDHTKSDKDKYHMISLMWNLKYDTNEHAYERKTDSHIQRTDLWFPRMGLGEEGKIGSLGLRMCSVSQLC